MAFCDEIIMLKFQTDHTQVFLSAKRVKPPWQTEEPGITELSDPDTAYRRVVFLKQVFDNQTARQFILNNYIRVNCRNEDRN